MFKRFSYYLPNLGQCWLLFAFVCLAGSLFAALIQFPLLLISQESDFITKVLSYVLMFIPVILYIIYKSKSIMLQDVITGVASKRVKLDNPNFGKMNPVVFFFLIFLGTFAISMILDPMTSVLKAPDWFNKIMEGMLGGKMIWAFVSVAICAPLLEEFLCRGIMLRGLLTHTTPLKAIFWSALIFAVLHLNPWQAIPAFVLGLYFGWVYYKTSSLWATIFLHFVNNSFSFLMFYLFPDLPMDASFRDLIPDGQTYWLLYALGIGIAALVFFFINKYVNNNEPEERAVSPEI